MNRGMPAWLRRLRFHHHGGIGDQTGSHGHGVLGRRVPGRDRIVTGFADGGRVGDVHVPGGAGEGVCCVGGGFPEGRIRRPWVEFGVGLLENLFADVAGIGTGGRAHLERAWEKAGRGTVLVCVRNEAAVPR